MNMVEAKKLSIMNIPVIVYGKRTDKVYVFVHGKMSNKESAQGFAEIAVSRGYQVLSFDLPEHGDRKEEKYPCNVWNGIHDLGLIGTYAQQNWQNISLFGCSLGAYFSLLAYKELPLKQCLFQSPILDMEYLIRMMFSWFHVTEDELKVQKEIPTPIDTLSWDYYCYVKDHPIEKWEVPTSILYGSEDQLQSRAVVDRFTERFHCDLTVAPGCDHAFGTPKQGDAVIEWLSEHIR